ncbi:MAG: hypothetical protein ACLS9A_04635 [Clostridia bacterium]
MAKNFKKLKADINITNNKKGLDLIMKEQTKERNNQTKKVFKSEKT